MPRGRFISKDICLDKQVNDLSSAESKLAFTWLIPHLDKEGRTYGDPAIVRAMIFPRRTDISVEQMESFIQEWHNVGLIIWYECDDDRYILFPNFDKHQIGLNKDREADSVIPIPDELLTLSCNDPDQIPVKPKSKSKSKLSQVEEEVEEGNNAPQLIKAFTDYTKLKPGRNAEKIATDLISAGVICEDIIKAVDWLRDHPPNKCTSFRSIEKSAIIEKDKRVAKEKIPDEEDYRKYIKGKFGEIGHQ